VLLATQTGSASAESSTLNCKSGPLTRTYGKTEWLVYGCDDDRTLIVVTAPGNPGFPFYFRLSQENGSYRLTGEGTGNKDATDATYKDLRRLSDKDIADLIAQTKKR
jgi:hypothetical protein